MTKLVAGRPVTGEISSYRRTPKAEQKPIEDFIAALDEIFAFPDVESVRWTQYTPSFNDGDPCVFTFGEFTVKLVGADPEGGDGEDGHLCGYGVNSHYSLLHNASYDWRNRCPLSAALEQHLGYDANPSYKDALETAFGDPAEVTATREGFHVEDYDCGH